MGIYVNPSNINFKKYVDNEIFIDKSLILRELNKDICTYDCFLCVSRPYGFGKTMTASMMDAYYSRGCDSSKLFESLKISRDPKFKEHLNKYNVLHVNVKDFYSRFGDETVKMIVKEVVEEFKKEFSDVKYSLSIIDIPECIMRVYKKTQTFFVVIFDEYDYLVRKNVKNEVLEEYLWFLNSIFKSSSTSSCIALGYLTGVLPMYRDKSQSRLNNIEEYSMTFPSKFSDMVGFTEDEVNQICKDYNINFEECKKWYGGYTLKGIKVYNPENILSAAKSRKFDKHRIQAFSCKDIGDYIRLDLEYIQDDIEKLMAGEEVEVNTSCYQNSLNFDKFRLKDDVFTYLIHFGYLAYNYDKETCYIPNHEMMQLWLEALKS